jgi:hypothetical protein
MSCAFIVENGNGLKFNLGGQIIMYVFLQRCSYEKSILMSLQQNISFSFCVGVDASKHYSIKKECDEKKTTIPHSADVRAGHKI